MEKQPQDIEGFLAGLQPELAAKVVRAMDPIIKMITDWDAEFAGEAIILLWMSLGRAVTETVAAKENAADKQDQETTPKE